MLVVKPRLTSRTIELGFVAPELGIIAKRWLEKKTRSHRLKIKCFRKTYLINFLNPVTYCINRAKFNISLSLLRSFFDSVELGLLKQWLPYLGPGNLVPRVLRFFGQRVDARRESGEFEKIYFFDWLLYISFVTASIVLPQKSSGGDKPLAKETEDPGYEIRGLRLCHVDEFPELLRFIYSTSDQEHRGHWERDDVCPMAPGYCPYRGAVDAPYHLYCLVFFWLLLLLLLFLFL